MWNNFKAWLQSPFAEDMNAFHWFLFFGLLIAISTMWGLVLTHTLGGIK